MGISYNRVVLVGNVTRDPEVRFTQGGTAVADLGLAMNDRRKGADGAWIEEVTFVDVTLWGRTAEVAKEYVHKGHPVLIEGRLKLDSWVDQAGQKRNKLKVVGERLQMLGTKDGGGSKPQSEYSEPEQPHSQRRPGDNTVPTEDIPF